LQATKSAAQEHLGYNEYLAKVQRIEAEHNDAMLRMENAHNKEFQLNKKQYETKIE
jgi:hypothetical protein